MKWAFHALKTCEMIDFTNLRRCEIVFGKMIIFLNFFCYFTDFESVLAFVRQNSCIVFRHFGFTKWFAGHVSKAARSLVVVLLCLRVGGPSPFWIRIKSGCLCLLGFSFFAFSGHVYSSFMVHRRRETVFVVWNVCFIFWKCIGTKDQIQIVFCQPQLQSKDLSQRTNAIRCTQKLSFLYWGTDNNFHILPRNLCF